MKKSKKLYYLFESIFDFALIGFLRLFSLETSGKLGSLLLQSIAPFHKVTDMARRNIAQAFPAMDKAEVEATLKACLQNLGYTLAEYANLDKLRKEHHHRIIIENPERVRDCVAEGKGLILYSAHSANWETIGIATDVLEDLKSSCVYRKSNNPYIDKWIAAMRKKYVLARQFPKGGQGTRGVIRHLKEGGVVCMLTDQKMNDGVPTKFFGRFAMSPAGAATIALRHNVPLMMVSTTRVFKQGEHCHFKVYFHEPFMAENTGDKKADIINTTQRLNDDLEEMIRTNPSQWLWLHKRWREE